MNDNVEHIIEADDTTEEVAEVEEVEEAEEVEENESEATTDEEEDSGEEEPAEAEEEKVPKGVQKRIDEVVRKQREAERQAESYRQELLRQRQQQQPPPQQQPFNPTRPKPTLESCDFDSEKLLDELSDWKLEQHEFKKYVHSQQQNQQNQQRQMAESFESNRAKTVDEGKAKFDDFEDVVYGLPAGIMHHGMAQAIFQTKAPADVTYFLGKNPEIAAQIAQLHPVAMAMELARLEGKATIPPKTKQTTKAPDPIKPVGKKAPAGAEPDPKTDPDGWLKWERERMRKKGLSY